LVSQLIAAFIAVDLVLGYKGDWCLGAGLITGLEIGLAIFGVSAGTYVEAVIMEALLFVIDKHIDFPTAPQCDVYK
jgi:hypothetical protein